MNYLLALILVFGLNVHPNEASPVPQVLLEVDRMSAGMVSNPGQYLYLRVLSDGQYELEISGAGEKKATQRRMLSPDKFVRLKQLLDSDAIKTLTREYAGAPVLDHLDKTTIKINRPTGMQEILVLNYCPQCSDANYPEGLVTLLCEIKSVRVKIDQRLMKQLPEICVL